MQYIQQQVKKVVASSKRAKMLHAAALRQSVTEMRCATSAVTSLRARMAVRR